MAASFTSRKRFFFLVKNLFSPHQDLPCHPGTGPPGLPLRTGREVDGGWNSSQEGEEEEEDEEDEVIQRNGKTKLASFPRNHFN